jgi:hypothetical protein
MANIHSWEEHDPVIHVHGDAAVVVYYYLMFFDVGGSITSTDGRDMFFFVREGQRWQVVAHQFSHHPV